MAKFERLQSSPGNYLIRDETDIPKSRYVLVEILYAYISKYNLFSEEAAEINLKFVF